MVELKLKSNYQEISNSSARLIAKKMIRTTNPVIGLPTGKTPEGAYDRMGQYYREGLLDFSEVTTFNLDEYYPIKKEDPKSFYQYMNEKLYSQVNLKRDRTHIPDGSIPHSKVNLHCKRYEKKIDKAGGVDLMVLGIGENGHIGFNEPGTELHTTTHLAKLSKETMEKNFSSLENTPSHAITMGLQTIMQSKEILLLATGERKAGAVEKALLGPVTKDCPASVLQLHPNVTFILDNGAAKNIDFA